jgi:Zinc finger C-x8-C-x5-C-x3-H type (and similar)/Nuclear fragile X mental retardation-interacting protein 1 (NUFIP1)
MPNTNNGFPPRTPGHIPSGFHAPQQPISKGTGTSGTSQYPPSALSHTTLPSSSIPMWQHHHQQFQGYDMGNPNYVFHGIHGYLPQASLPPPTHYSQQPTQQPRYYTSTSYNYPPTLPHTQPHNYSFHAQIASPPPPPPPPPPPKEEFRCQPCNIVLDSAPALRAHTTTHIKCDKCSFTAAPKVVKGHYSAVHGQYAGNGFKSVSIAIPGSKKVQRFQICVGNHPDDIQRWIAERRKRFPRQSNKQQLQQQTSTAQLTNISSSNETAPVKNESALLGSLLAGYGSSSDDENDGINDDEATRTTTKLHGCGTESKLSGLNSTSNVCHTQGDESIQHPQPTQQYRTRLCRYFAKNGQCRNGDTCSFSHDRTTVSNHEQSSNNNPGQDDRPATKKQKMNPNGTAANKSSGNVPPPPQSLLHKLLANDIQREASLTLQLLEYLVRSNFLQQTDDSSNSDD